MQVNALIESFLLQERTIILCVIPSNQDIATVDILERAQKVSTCTAVVL
jgi:interferon-induced GTP-binding protein Mx